MRRHRPALPRRLRPASAYDRTDLLLVLAIDASASIGTERGRMQIDGYRAALADPRVLDAISTGFIGAIGIAAVAWAGINFQRRLVPWTWVTERSDAAAFGEALVRAWGPIPDAAAAEDFPNGALTCISRGLDFARALMHEAPWDSARRVIDVSGDGPNNEGPPVEEARDRAVAEGMTINGLAIEGDPDIVLVLGPGAMLADYYRDAVIGGPGAFVAVAEDMVDFGAAIRRKLVFEVAGRAAGD